MVGHRARVGKILVAEDAKGPANLRDIRCSSQGVIQLPPKRLLSTRFRLSGISPATGAACLVLDIPRYRTIL